jgi:two-component system response regulator HydG
MVEQVAKFDATVMIRGETGTGKERLARAIHMKSVRADKAFVPLVCNAVPDNLIESTLFGYRKGAYTGATRDQIGLLEAADGGTLFLDEVGDIPAAVQVKLLRVLQEGEFQRLGDIQPTSVDIRVLTATHRDLEAEIEEGNFREDLYYRLKLIEMKLPPLRERRDDIPLLAHHFLRLSCQKYGKEINRIAPEVLSALQGYHWPGNVRQLEHIIARSLILEASDTLQLGALSGDISEKNVSQAKEGASVQENTYIHLPFKSAKQQVVQRFEKRYLRNLLMNHNSNISKAARVAEMD